MVSDQLPTAPKRCSNSGNVSENAVRIDSIESKLGVPKIRP